ncbi:MAG: hypothetical protein OXU23_15525, partial [Candidatus Poribacteria bacterium]|nr:hypothetical protein [Candidatus Poribacteria bacterium]
MVPQAVLVPIAMTVAVPTVVTMANGRRSITVVMMLAPVRRTRRRIFRIMSGLIGVMRVQHHKRQFSVHPGAVGSVCNRTGFYTKPFLRT